MDASPSDNPLDQIIQDEEFDRFFHSAYYDGGGDDDGGGVGDDDDELGGFQDNDVDSPMDGDSNGDEVDDGCATPKWRYWLLELGSWQTSTHG